MLSGEVASIKGNEKSDGTVKKVDNGARLTSPPIAFDTIRSVASSSDPKREASDAEKAIANKK